MSAAADRVKTQIDNANLFQGCIVLLLKSPGGFRAPTFELQKCLGGHVQPAIGYMFWELPKAFCP